MGKTRASMEPAGGKAREKQYGEKLTPGTNRRSSPLVIFSSFQNSIAPNVSVLKKVISVQVEDVYQHLANVKCSMYVWDSCFLSVKFHKF